MHVKQYSSLGQAIFDRLGNSGRKDPHTMFTRKKDPDPKPPFSKDPLSGAFSKSSVLGPERFQKDPDTCDRSMYPGSKSSVFEKNPGTCARSLSKEHTFFENSAR